MNMRQVLYVHARKVLQQGALAGAVVRKNTCCTCRMFWHTLAMLTQELMQSGRFGIAVRAMLHKTILLQPTDLKALQVE